MVTIYSPSGTEICSVSFNSGAKGYYMLMQHDYIILPFSLASPVDFPIGSYVDLTDTLDDALGGKLRKKYYIISKQTPVYNTSTGGYEYKLRFDAYYWLWNNYIFKYLPESPGNEASWSLTATLDVHLDVFLRNLSSLGFTFNGAPFSYSIDDTVANKAVTMTYDNIHLTDALISLGGKDKFDCDVWITENVINFGRCEHSDVVKLEVGVEASDMTREDSKGTFATRIYAFGSTRNIPPNYRPVSEPAVVNGVVQKRLMLPEGTPYVDAYDNLPQTGVIETVVTFDDIYPRRIGILSDVTYRTDTADNADGTQTSRTFYRYKDTELQFKDEYFLEGQELQITFQSGKLNGMTFGVKFNPDGKEPEEQLWEIVGNENYGRFLPDDILKPEDGDKIVLSGFDIQLVSDKYIPDAEQELLEKTRQYKDKIKIDDGTYKVPLRSTWVKADEIHRTFDIGQKVNLINPAFFVNGRQSRVIGWEMNLDYPWDSPVYTIGESAQYSRLNDIENKIDTLTYRGQTYTGGNSGSSIYVIRTNDRTAASDSNIYSALRSRSEFLSKTAADAAMDVITFLKGLLVGDGDYGIDADGTARLKRLLADEATMKTLTVTGRAHFFELVIDELNSVGGQLIISAANCTVRSVERISGAWRLWWLAEDSDGRAVQNMWKVGDQALAMTSNLAEGTSYDARNRLWWRLVTATGSGTRNIDGEDRKCHWIEVSEATCAADSLEPAEGDSVCLCGHRGDDTARSHAIIIAAHSTPDTELESPSFAQYNGITSFSLSQYRTTWFAANGNKIRGELDVDTSGLVSYTHLAWGNGPDDWTKDKSQSTAKDWLMLGICTDRTKSDVALVYSDYAWSRIKGTDGKDGTSFTVKGSVDDESMLPPTGNSTGDAYLVNGYLWVWDGSAWANAGKIQGPAGEDGADGKTTYFHIRYSPNPDGVPMSETPDKYIGTYVDFTETDSTDASDYTWSRFEGIQGEQGLPGVNGTDGTTYYLHIKYSNDGGVTFTGNNGEDSGDWIGVLTDTNPTDSGTPSDYKWSKIKGDTGEKGDKGEQGVPGPAGEDGRTTYFHVKYSANSNGTPMSEVPNLYIGTYVDFTEADSDDPSDYTWSRFQGYDGEQGIPGTNGTDGKTSYLHIKYSDDGGKTFTANNGETPGAWLGQCVDFNSYDPTSVTSYKWTRIRGEDGADGSDGEPGTDGQDGFSWALDPAAITLEADSDGVVSMQDATSRLRAWLGTREMTVTITAIEPVHCLASRNGAQVTITAIGTYTADWGGSVPYGAGWVQITAQATLGGETRSVSCRLSFTVSSIALSSQIKAETDSISLKVGYLGAKDGNMVTTPDIFLTGNGNKVYTIGDVSSLRGKTITVSCLVKTVSAVPAASGNRRIGMEPMVRYADGSTQYLGTWRQITSTDTFEGRISSTHRIQDKAVASVEQRNLYIQGISSGYASVSRPKIETGADATDWGLSAEDRLKRPNLLPGTSDFSQCTVQDTVEAGAYTTPYGEKISVAHGVNEAGTSYKDVITWRNVVPEPGVQYTLSFWARGTGSIGSYFYPNCTDWVTSPGTKNQTGVTDGFVQFTLESGWNRYQVTWSTRNDVSGGKSLIAARLMPDSSAQGEVWICGVKLEKGSEATDWRSETITRDELQATGIDIEHKRIKVTADNFEIQNNSGETVTTIDEAGTLTGVMLRTMDEGQGHVEIKGGLIEVKNPNGVTNIKMGYNGSYMLLSYYDNDGTFLYDLGPWGLSGKDVSEERWETSSKYGRLQLTGTTFSTVGDIVGNKQIMNTIFQYGHVYTKTPLYMYLAGRVNDTYLSGDYASTAEIARAANGRWFMEQGNVTTAQAVTGMWAQDNPESFMIGSPMDTPPMDYTRYEDDYAEKVDFSKQWCSRNVYRFSNIEIVQPGSGTVYYGSMITTTAVYMNYDRVQMIQINPIDDDDTDTNGNIYL